MTARTKRVPIEMRTTKAKTTAVEERTRAALPRLARTRSQLDLSKDVVVVGAAAVVVVAVGDNTAAAADDDDGDIAAGAECCADESAAAGVVVGGGDGVAADAAVDAAAAAGTGRIRVARRRRSIRFWSEVCSCGECCY